ncbi:hypothetical protein [Leptospira ainlahdjerensis]|uniref:hypothetical protein n=1 Tax=Leptospira ainlahdjerensis TaxID=2810033 RepID=UPI001E4850C2|nr:hypothetical protein [Leptospira ainlahdjerensis]
MIFSGAGEKKVTFIQSIVVDGSQKIWESLTQFPFLLLFGEGFSTFGALKGGDYGFIETFLRFGIPFFVVLIFVILKISWNVYLFEKKERFFWGGADFRFLKFSSFVLLFLLLMDLHYSTWHLKSVLPIVFIALGLYSRFFLLLRKRSTL